MNETPHPSPYSKSEVKKHFDDILAKQIKRLVESESSKLSFNLSTVACLLIIVERDEEIINFPDNPPERYVRESFLQEIQDMGLEVDDDLMEAIQSLAGFGYIDIAADGTYHSMIPAFAIVNFLNNLFPGMPGLNLVAYIIQLIDEIISGRKALEEAKSSFEQTLVSKGVSFSQQKMMQEEKKVPEKTAKAKPEAYARPKEVVSRKSISQRLAKLRSGARGESAKTPSYRPLFPTEPTAQVKDVFEKEPVENKKKEQEKRDQEKVEQEKELERVRQDLEKQEAELREMGERKAREEREKARIEAEEKKERERAAELEKIKAEMEALVRAREADILAKEEEMKLREEALAEKMRREQEEKEKKEEKKQPEEARSLEEIEKKIAFFEQQQQAMPCPLCGSGKITSEKTGADKTYYLCSNDNCNFISWFKPYQMSCPICGNPYLVEFLNPESGMPQGLKCSRSGCSFLQEGFLPPAVKAVPPQAEEPPKKKKKYIKRVKRKK